MNTTHTFQTNLHPQIGAQLSGAVDLRPPTIRFPWTSRSQNTTSVSLRDFRASTETEHCTERGETPRVMLAADNAIESAELQQRLL